MAAFGCLVWLVLAGASPPAPGYPYAPYHDGRLDPQTTGWPLTDAERAFVLRPEHERRPGSEAGQHLPAMWPVTPSAGFWGGTQWLETHAKLVDDAVAARGPIDILLVGDSLTQQWGGQFGQPFAPAWQAAFGRLKAVNLGIGGDKTQNLLWRLDHGGVDGLEPRLVVLMIGNNNMFFTPETGIDAAAQGIRQCVRNLRGKFPAAPLILVKILPAHAPGNAFYEDIRRTNAALDGLRLDADPQIRVLDLWSDVTQLDGTLKPGLFSPDNIHLTQDLGYALYARRLKPLVDALLESGAAEDKPMLFAAYYVWYHDGAHPTEPWRHWTSPAVEQLHPGDNPLAQPGDPPLISTAYPLAGLYSSRDAGVAEWHMRLARAAGIDAFLVSWWGANRGLDETFAGTTLPAAERAGMKVALLDELAQYHHDEAVYRAGLAAALQRFQNSPAYLRIDGRPVVYLYQVAADPGLTPESFATVRQHVEAEVGPVYWIVDKLAHNPAAPSEDQIKQIPPEWLTVEGIDSFAFYSTFSHFRAHTYDELAGKYRHLVSLAHGAGKKMILPVHPGHDNSRFREDPYVMPRRDGQTLRDYLRAARDAGADAVLVTSWNEWPESTVVEPSSTWEDPYFYLRLLAEWRGRPFTPIPPPR